ncbi:MAG: polyketide cyclase [Candidatus Accumulibacter sp. UW26]|jgi:hypothetical protein
MSTRFVMISRWHLPTTRERLWSLLTEPTEWPGWWPQLHGVSRLEDGDPDGVGASHAFVWHSGLGYRLRTVMTTTRASRMRELEAAASGDLRGIGLWLIEDDLPPGVLRLTYRWDVELSKPWMRLLAPLLQDVFTRRHFAVMASGADGMARQLGCRRSAIEEWSTITRLADDRQAA